MEKILGILAIAAVFYFFYRKGWLGCCGGNHSKGNNSCQMEKKSDKEIER